MKEKTSNPQDPCRLARQVNEIGQPATTSTKQRNPCRLVRQVNEIGRLESYLLPLTDPCQLVWRGEQCPGIPKLIHLPDKPAGVCRAALALRLAGQSRSPAGRAGRGLAGH
jgi:hypothetical protein